MKKKLMMVTALVGLLSFSACVDNNETQSVTNVRDAKAKQYKARADMNNAEAQAIQIMADADAALLNAKAQAAKANAAKAQAEAETILKKKDLVELQKEAATLKNEAALIENQKAQAELEKALSDLEVAKANAEKELARIEGELEANRLLWEAALLDAEKKLLKAKQDLQAELDNDPTAAEELQTLVNAYSTAVSNLTAAQKDLAAAKKDLVTLEEDLIAYPEYKAEQTNILNNDIKLYEAYIAKYKEYSKYTEEDLEPMKLKYAELVAQADKLGDDYNVASRNYSNVYNEAVSAKNNPQSAYYLAKEEVANSMMYKLLEYKELTIEDAEGEEIMYHTWDSYNVFGTYYSLGQIVYTYSFQFANDNNPNGGDNISAYDRYKTISLENEKYGVYNMYDVDSLSLEVCEMPMELRQIELNAEGIVSELEAAVKTASDEQAEWKKQYDGKATKAYDPWLNEVIDWTPTRNAVDSTKYEYDLWQKALADAKVEQTVKDSLKNTYQDALNIELALKSQIDSYDAELKNATNFLAAVDAYVAVFQNWEKNTADLQALVDAFNAESDKLWAETVEAWTASVELEWEKYDVQAEYNAINYYLYYYNGQEGALSLQNTIKYYEAQIEDCKKAIEDLDNVESKEQAIAYAKARVVAKEAVVAARQVAVDEAKAALDEAMPKTEE